MNSKPLGYDSLKCVLSHMEGNKRIDLSRRCPSIRRAEKVAPLQLDKLGILKKGFRLNGTEYEIEIHQKYRVGDTPDCILHHNRMGGYTTDLNNFGLKDGRFLNVLTPGDILIKEEQWEENNEPLEERIQDIEEYIHQHGDPVGFSRGEYAPRNELIFLKHLHEKVPVPYENMFCLKISTSTRSKKVEFYSYNMKYYQAIKKLAMLLLGERPVPIAARKMIIQHQNVIRLPPKKYLANSQKYLAN